jgi:hypothetical protein
MSALLFGTIMVTLFGRCVIALGLKLMPWNKTRQIRLNGSLLTAVRR